MRNLFIVLALILFASAVFSVEFQRDITYGKAGDVELKLDFIKPDGDGPFPTVVCIHGGGWRAGNKNRWHGLMQTLAKNGFAAASVSYRFAPQHKFPAQIEDVKCAVRFLRSKSADWKLDPKRFAALGDSAGGHLSLLLGVTTKADNLEGTSGSNDQDSSVQCVVNYYGPTDFTVPGAWNPVVVGMVSDFLGTADQSADVMKKASPITYVRKNLPPIITFQGTHDQLVPEDQATRFHAALKKAGITEERCEIIKNAGHGFSGPDAEFVNKNQLEFLKKYLQPK